MKLTPAVPLGAVLVLILTLGGPMIPSTPAQAQDAQMSQDDDGDMEMEVDPEGGTPVAAAPADVPYAMPDRGPVTNLPMPRFVSLKGSEGNARRGPSLSHRIDWVFKHRGMPLRVTAEYGHWRRIEDRDGAGGWVHYSLISGVRTVIVNNDMTELHARADTASPVVALAEAGAILRLEKCTRDWCEITADDADGWVPKPAIWGVDPDELRD